VDRAVPGSTLVGATFHGRCDRVEAGGGVLQFLYLRLKSGLIRRELVVSLVVYDLPARTAPWAENMTSGLVGLVDGLNDDAGHPSAVTGAAIYPHWETDDGEWRSYRALWTGQ
jgi:hypothetical protein